MKSFFSTITLFRSRNLKCRSPFPIELLPKFEEALQLKPNLESAFIEASVKADLIAQVTSAWKLAELHHEQSEASSELPIFSRDKLWNGPESLLNMLDRPTAYL